MSGGNIKITFEAQDRAYYRYDETKVGPIRLKTKRCEDADLVEKMLREEIEEGLKHPDSIISRAIRLIAEKCAETHESETFRDPFKEQNQ